MISRYDCLVLVLGISSAAAWVSRGKSLVGRHRMIRSLAASEQDEDETKGPARLLIVASRLPVVKQNIKISYPMLAAAFSHYRICS